MSQPVVPEAQSQPGAQPDERGRMLAQTLGAFGLLGVLVALLHHFMQDPIEHFGRAFVARFGVAGMALGTFLCDGLHIPPPPQVYIVILVTSGGPQFWALIAIMFASVCASPVSYNLARLLSRVPFFDKRFKASAPKIERLMARYGYGAVIFGAASPIPYPLLCNLSGIYRIPWRYVGVMVALRPLRLLVMYWFIRAGWS